MHSEPSSEICSCYRGTHFSQELDCIFPHMLVGLNEVFCIVWLQPQQFPLPFKVIVGSMDVFYHWSQGVCITGQAARLQHFKRERFYKQIRLGWNWPTSSLCKMKNSAKTHLRDSLVMHTNTASHKCAICGFNWWAAENKGLNYC